MDDEGGAMRLSDLIRKPRLTEEKNDPEAIRAEPFKPVRDDPPSRLIPAEEEAIRNWLASIGEDDPAVADEVVRNCRTDAGARTYFLKCAARAETP
jgi:hypothetical protein